MKTLLPPTPWNSVRPEDVSNLASPPADIAPPPPPPARYEVELPSTLIGTLVTPTPPWFPRLVQPAYEFFIESDFGFDPTQGELPPPEPPSEPAACRPALLMYELVPPPPPPPVAI